MFPATLFQGRQHHAFRLAGGDSAALLIHGFPGTPAEMQAIGTSLNALGWSVHGILLPGFGPEIGQLGEKKYEDWIGAVLNELDSLIDQFPTTMICGFSMGAALALIASASRQVNGTVLLAPYWSVSNWLWNLTPMIQLIFPEIKPFRFMNFDLGKPVVQQGLRDLLSDADLTDPKIRKQLRAYTFPTRIINELRKVGLSASKSAERINTPVLAIQGNHDEIVKTTRTKELIRRIPISVSFKEVDAGHDLTDPEKPAWNTIQSSINEFSQAIQKQTQRISPINSQA